MQFNKESLSASPTKTVRFILIKTWSSLLCGGGGLSLSEVRRGKNTKHINIQNALGVRARTFQRLNALLPVAVKGNRACDSLHVFYQS